LCVMEGLLKSWFELYRLASGLRAVQFAGDNSRFLQTSFQDELKLIQKYEELFSAASRNSVPSELLAEVAAVRELTDWPYLQEEIPRAMDQMLEGLDRVSTIVRSMKEFSHVDRSNEKSPADLNHALEGTLVVARNQWKYVADVETDFGPLPLVVCHLGDLNQFLNIVVNAAVGWSKTLLRAPSFCN
jgi:signal transduction histidine kinase